MSKLEVDAIEPQSGTTLTLGASGDTVNVAAGATNNLGITMADQWRLTADLTGTDGTISANLERVDSTGQGTLGTAMSVSSGIWTFPSTGIYLVSFFSTINNAVAADNASFQIQATTDNSSYSMIALSQDSSGGASQDQTASVHASTLLDVTDTTNVKVKFVLSSFAADTRINGSTTSNQTCFTFIRLGDT